VAAGARGLGTAVRPADLPCHCPGTDYQRIDLRQHSAGCKTSKMASRVTSGRERTRAQARRSNPGDHRSGVVAMRRAQASRCRTASWTRYATTRCLAIGSPSSYPCHAGLIRSQVSPATCAWVVVIDATRQSTCELPKRSPSSRTRLHHPHAPGATTATRTLRNLCGAPKC
jgi:hypothetical protein